MASALTWLDSSSASRRHAMEVIKLFEEKGTVDEIGIGSVRDALSDTLFPGTSVLHTRARYFLFVPWTYRYLEARRTPSATIAKEARRLEIGLIDTLVAGDDVTGTIGRVAKQRLRNLPSTMYWSGLRVWGPRVADLSQEQYHRSLDRFYRLRSVGQRDDDGQPLDGPQQRTWHAGLPVAPVGFPKCPLSFALPKVEAEYLRECLLAHCSGTLLAHLVDRCQPTENVPFVWEHPESGGFPAGVVEQLSHARNLSEVINGAAILYNLMLAEQGEKAGLTQLKDRVEEHGESFERWVRLMKARAAVHALWDRKEFWQLVLTMNARIPLPTRAFVDSWLDLALSANPEGLKELSRARRLITDRERAIKGRLARLQNSDALRRWGGSSGAAQLDFRWNPQVARIVADIQRGLSLDA